MRDNRRRKKNDEEASAPPWMITYSDMVTLVLAFFVLLYSFSAIDVERFQEVMSALQITFTGRTGILESSQAVGAETGERIDIANLPGEAAIQASLGEREESWLQMMQQMQETYEKVQAFLREAELEDEVELRWEERGIVMELPERILFDSGEAVLKEEFLPTLELLADLLRLLPNQVIIEGHTDNVPIHTFLYPTNWELSVARAVAVCRYFVEEQGLHPKRFLPAGYGEYHPIDSNETEEGRARNRRVTVVISLREVELEE